MSSSDGTSPSFMKNPEAVRAILGRMLAGETFENVDVSLRARDGSLRQVQVSANAFREADRIVHTRCSLRDVTELKRLEEESVQMQKLDASAIQRRFRAFARPSTREAERTPQSQSSGSGLGHRRRKSNRLAVDRVFSAVIRLRAPAARGV